MAATSTNQRSLNQANQPLRWDKVKYFSRPHAVRMQSGAIGGVMILILVVQFAMTSGRDRRARSLRVDSGQP